jgi:hypothetical protein
MAKSVDPFVRDRKIPPVLMPSIANFDGLFARDYKFPMILVSSLDRDI